MKINIINIGLSALKLKSCKGFLNFYLSSLKYEVFTILNVDKRAV
jgi:hypothetical protein